MSHKYRCKNPQQNPPELSNEIYPKNAKVLQYKKINLSPEIEPTGYMRGIY
jgi:hypothetical protein